MAPKPRVYGVSVYTTWNPGTPRHIKTHWKWECPGCTGIRGNYMLTYRQTVRRAVQHSRIHTAERVAERLDELSSKFADASKRVPEIKDYLEGGRDAFADSADLVRDHLVSGTRKENRNG